PSGTRRPTIAITAASLVIQPVETSSKWGAIKAAFSKVGGFAKAIGGKFSDFKKWYDGLSWWVRAPSLRSLPG
ncbi:hypothetical protein, partial [Streptomyces sp. WG5]|uniref:hypothetical protein n=1 Tax=Streptomyces sp. WG5 TaxID=3417648 RepID=UPI003CF606F6